MRWCAAIVGILLASVSVADDKPTIRTLELNQVELVYPDRATEPKPVIITTADDLTKASQFANDASRAAIKKQVDFAKEKLVIFVWAGSGGDRLMPDMKINDGKASIVFRYKMGFTDDFRQHAAIFAIPKDATVEVKK
jgi:hypothetical protein